MGKYVDLKPENQFSSLDSTLECCVSFGKSLHLSEFPVSHLSNAATILYHGIVRYKEGSLNINSERRGRHLSCLVLYPYCLAK